MAIFHATTTIRAGLKLKAWKVELGDVFRNDKIFYVLLRKVRIQIFLVNLSEEIGCMQTIENKSKEPITCWQRIPQS